MIKHAVMWNWAEKESRERINEKVEIIRKELEKQVGTIPGCLSVDEVAARTVEWHHTRDLFVMMTFKDEETLLAHHKHPIHLEIAGPVDDLVTDLTIVDYYVPDPA